MGYHGVDDSRSFHLEPPDGVDGPSIFLQAVPEPKRAKNRLHMDWDVADMEAEADRLVALGASRGERFEIPWAPIESAGSPCRTRRATSSASNRSS